MAADGPASLQTRRRTERKYCSPPHPRFVQPVRPGRTRSPRILPLRPTAAIGELSHPKIGDAAMLMRAQTRERATPESPRASPSHPSPGGPASKVTPRLPAPGRPFACRLSRPRSWPWRPRSPGGCGLGSSGARFPLRFPSPVPLAAFHDLESALGRRGRKRPRRRGCGTTSRARCTSCGQGCPASNIIVFFQIACVVPRKSVDGRAGRIVNGGRRRPMRLRTRTDHVPDAAPSGRPSPWRDVAARVGKPLRRLRPLLPGALRGRGHRRDHPHPGPLQAVRPGRLPLHGLREPQSRTCPTASS